MLYIYLYGCSGDLRISFCVSRRFQSPRGPLAVAVAVARGKVIELLCFFSSIRLLRSLSQVSPFLSFLFLAAEGH